MQFGQYGFQNLKTNKSVQGVMQNRHEHFLFFLKHIRTCYTIHSYLNVCFICCRTNPFVFFIKIVFINYQTICLGGKYISLYAKTGEFHKKR